MNDSSTNNPEFSLLLHFLTGSQANSIWFSKLCGILSSGQPPFYKPKQAPSQGATLQLPAGLQTGDTQSP